MDLVLTDAEVDLLSSAVAARCTERDLVAALARYPGLLEKATCYSDGVPLNEQVMQCLRNIGIEQTYYVRSFVLRLLENQWRDDLLRRAAISAAPVLVRAPRQLDRSVAMVAGALQSLIDLLPDKPRSGQIGDPVVFAALCEHRGGLLSLAACLDGFEAVKAVHDGLHTLQVLGADWLDWTQSAPSVASPAAMAALVRRARQAVLAPGLDSLPGPLACRERAAKALDEAERLLAAGGPDELHFARSTLRALLIAELPLIDQMLFEISREVPIKALSRAFTAISTATPVVLDLGEARDRAIDLADTLLRRLMEHAVWQATDLRLYEIEEHLYDPGPTWLTVVYQAVIAVRLNLRALIGFADGTQSLTAPISDALIQYEGTAAASIAVPDESDPAFVAIRTAFEDLRSDVRSNFLEVDQVLKADFARCALIRDRLDTLLRRVPRLCGLMLP